MKLKRFHFSVILATNKEATNLTDLNAILTKKLGW